MSDEGWHWVTLPEALGRVTGFRQVGDRMICDTQSGVPFVIPLRKIVDSGQGPQISLSPKPVP